MCCCDITDIYPQQSTTIDLYFVAEKYRFGILLLPIVQLYQSSANHAKNIPQVRHIKHIAITLLTKEDIMAAPTINPIPYVFHFINNTANNPAATVNPPMDKFLSFFTRFSFLANCMFKELITWSLISACNIHLFNWDSLRESIATRFLLTVSRPFTC